MSNRREFILNVGLGTAAALAAGQVFAKDKAEKPAKTASATAASTASAAAASNMVLETDAQAAALGYKSDATKTDTAKYKSYAVGQKCDSCALFQGRAGDKAGACPLFAGKQVSASGWCSAYAKKA